MIDDLLQPPPENAKAIRRKRLIYSPPPIAYEFERLPAPEHFKDMGLAFQEDYFEPLKLSRLHLWPYLKFTALIVLLIGGYFLLGPKYLLALTAALFFLTPTLFARSARQFHDSQLQLSAATVLLLLLGGVFLIADSFQNVRMVLLVFGALMAGALWFIGGDFFKFSNHWLHAHPCLRVDERQQLLRSTTYPGINILPLGISFFVLLVSPNLSAFPVLVLLYMVFVLFLVRGELFDRTTSQPGTSIAGTMRVAITLVAEYFTYGSRFKHPLPGVWNPDYSYLTRRRIAAIALLLLLFNLAIGTKCFFAWDAPPFRHAYETMFAETIYSSPSAWLAVQRDLPFLDWVSITSKQEVERNTQSIAELRGLTHRGTLDQQMDRGITIVTLNDRQKLAPLAMREVAAIWYNHQPNNWIEVAIRNTISRPYLVLASALFALINAILLPLLLLVTSYQRSLLTLVRAHANLQSRIAAETKRSPWECFVDRIRHSDHVVQDPTNPEMQIKESDHVFLGVEAVNGYPVLLHRPILNEHVYISGGSGSGKTSLGILSLLVQLIRGAPQDGSGDGAMPPIVIIDLKGEHALLHSVREEVRRKAEEEGRTLNDCFRLFTCAKGMPTHYFNPLSDMAYPGRYVADLTNLLLDALELNHGPGYGRSFFSRHNYMQLHTLLSSKQPVTFADLCEAMAKGTAQHKGERQQAFELLATLYGLMEFEQLRPPPGIPESETISMRKVVEERQVVYFWLPTIESSMIARQIANLALFSFFTAMRARTEARHPQRQAYLVVDEFQRLAGDRFNVILQQARGFGLSAILSNQSISDLKTPSYDLRSAINHNTRMKLFFSFSDPRERTDFSMRSGEELVYMRSGTYDLTTDEQPDYPLFDQWRHGIKPRVTTNDMLRVTDHPLQCYLDIRSGSGYSQFGGAVLPLQMFHPIRLAEFQKRRDITPWPSREDLGMRSTTIAAISTEEVDAGKAAMLAKLDGYIQAFDDEFPNLRFS